jgi:hypothetical protein
VTTRQPRQWLEPWTLCGMLAAAMTPQLRQPQLNAAGAQHPLGERGATGGAEVPGQKSPFFLLGFPNPGNSL